MSVSAYSSEKKIREIKKFSASKSGLEFQFYLYEIIFINCWSCTHSVHGKWKWRFCSESRVYKNFLLNICCLSHSKIPNTSQCLFTCKYSIKLHRSSILFAVNITVKMSTLIPSNNSVWSAHCIKKLPLHDTSKSTLSIWSKHNA